MTTGSKQIKRVVVYRVGSLGDTLVVLPAFNLVRDAFPGAHITLLTNFPVTAKAAPMESILENTGLHDDTLRYPTPLRNFRELSKLREQLKAGRYDCMVYLAAPRGGLFASIRDYLFFRSCGIPKVIGVPFARRTLRCVRVPGTNRFTSETARTLEAIRELGTVDVTDPKWWDMCLTGAELDEAAALLNANRITTPFLAASVGTKCPANDWEVANWSELIRRLAVEHPQLPLVLLGAQDEKDRSEELMAVWSGPKLNLCGVTSPRVSAALLRNAAVMVCHDSGPMHLAATVGVPCVAIFSARNPPGVWYPHGENHTILYHRTPCWGCGLAECVEKKKVCILSITVDEVYDAVEKQLARKDFFPEAKPGSPARTEVACAFPGPVAPPPIPVSRVRSSLARQAGGQRERSSAASPQFTVLLVGNYIHDGQESMQRFATVMKEGLAAAGVDVEVIRPEPFFGRLHPGATGLGKWLGYLDKFLAFPFVLKKKVATLNSRPSPKLVVHICDHSNAFYTRYLREVPHLVTCHDMLAVRSALGEIPQNPTRWSGRILQKFVLRGLEAARVIACDSEATRRDVARLAKGADSRSTVTTIGLNAPFHPVPEEEARAHVVALMRANGTPVADDARYIVHVGGDQWYKNRNGVVDVFCELRRSSDQADLRLMMVGKPLTPKLRTLIDDSGLRDRVVELPGVSHRDLCALYSAAELLLFPSLQEGFGWPIIEAQACGCRVVTTDRSPMNEIGGDAAAYLDPEDVRSSVEVLRRVIEEGAQQRRERIERGFANAAKYSTRGMIDNYLALYSSLVPGGS